MKTEMYSENIIHAIIKADFSFVKFSLICFVIDKKHNKVVHIWGSKGDFANREHQQIRCNQYAVNVQFC